jgi:hypothetical protein
VYQELLVLGCQLMAETHDKKVVKENINGLSKSVEYGRSSIGMLTKW